MARGSMCHYQNWRIDIARVLHQMSTFNVGCNRENAIQDRNRSRNRNRHNRDRTNGDRSYDACEGHSHTMDRYVDADTLARMVFGTGNMMVASPMHYSRPRTSQLAHIHNHCTDTAGWCCTDRDIVDILWTQHLRTGLGLPLRN